jgi:hypothetical protein
MTMTTTEGRAARPEPRIRLSSLEWRLYLTALLSGVYAIAWITLAARAPRVTAAAVGDVRGVLPARAPARSVWLSDLPAAERPAVALPPGWVIATASGQRRPGDLRRPAARRLRIRTRTS